MYIESSKQTYIYNTDEMCTHKLYFDARLSISLLFFSHSLSVWPDTTPIPKIDIHFYRRQRRTSHIFHDWWSYQNFVCRWWHIIKHHTKTRTFDLTQTGWVRKLSSWCRAFLSSLILLADNYPSARGVVWAIKCENEDGLTQSHGRWDWKKGVKTSRKFITQLLSISIWNSSRK